MGKTRTAVIMARFATNYTISSEQIVITTEVIQDELRKRFHRKISTYVITKVI